MVDALLAVIATAQGVLGDETEKGLKAVWHYASCHQVATFQVSRPLPFTSRRLLLRITSRDLPSRAATLSATMRRLKSPRVRSMSLLVKDRQPRTLKRGGIRSQSESLSRFVQRHGIWYATSFPDLERPHTAGPPSRSTQWLLNASDPVIARRRDAERDLALHSQSNYLHRNLHPNVEQCGRQLSPDKRRW